MVIDRSLNVIASKTSNVFSVRWAQARHCKIRDVLSSFCATFDFGSFSISFLYLYSKISYENQERRDLHEIQFGRDAS